MTSRTNFKILIAAALLVFSFFCAGTFVDWNFQGADFGKWKKCMEILTGFWLLFAMMYCVLTALRIPRVDRFFEGLPETLRSHRKVGIATAVLLFLHWAAAKGPKWLVALGLMEASQRKRGQGADPTMLEEIFKFLKDSGEWLGYAMIILLALTLFGFFLRHNTWLKQHRLFGLLTFLGTLHGIGSVPNPYQGSWVMAAVVLLTIPCGWLLYRQAVLDAAKPQKGTVTRASRIEKDILEITVRPDDPDFSIRSGQFVRLSFDEAEYPHPFTVSEVTRDGNGRTEYSVLVKALGSYTGKIQNEDLVGRQAYFQGPYGEFMSSVPSSSLWVAGGIGISPFIAKLNDKSCHLEDVTLVWSFRSKEEKLLRHLEELCAGRGVRLFAFNTAQGERISWNGRFAEITDELKPKAAFFCGPASLEKALRSNLRLKGITSVKSEYFNWR